MHPSLRIVSINDVYTLENLPRLRNLVKHHAETAPGAFLAILAGDFLAPSLLSSLDSGRAMVECLNAIGITHVVFGNHEDDVPLAELRQRIAELRATWLATNVHGFEPPLPASQILELARPGGAPVRVGLLGVVVADATVYRGHPFGGAALEVANDAALREAARLVRDERCACVIPITHQSIEDDRALARLQRRPPFPVIVGGHEHTVFLEHVDGTWIVKAGHDAERAFVVDLAWPDRAPADGAPDLPQVTVELQAVADYPEDAELRALVEARMAKVHALEDATLYAIEPGELLSSVGSRARQTSMGTLVCSRVRDALGADACLFNGGGIRAGREYERRLTYGDVKAELPFDNEVVVARLTGRLVREAVAASRAQAPAESGGYLQVDDRTQVEEPAHLVTTLAGAPLDPDREYRVAVVRELLLGMDRIEPFVTFAREHPERIPPAGSGREIKLVLVESFARSLWRQLGGFDAVDANHDGVVTPSELESALRSPVTAELVLHALDTGHDDVITRDEAEAASKVEAETK